MHSSIRTLLDRIDDKETLRRIELLHADSPAAKSIYESLKLLGIFDEPHSVVSQPYAIQNVARFFSPFFQWTVMRVVSKSWKKTIESTSRFPGNIRDLNAPTSYLDLFSIIKLDEAEFILHAPKLLQCKNMKSVTFYCLPEKRYIFPMFTSFLLLSQNTLRTLRVTTPYVINHSFPNLKSLSIDLRYYNEPWELSLLSNAIISAKAHGIEELTIHINEKNIKSAVLAIEAACEGCFVHAFRNVDMKIQSAAFLKEDAEEKLSAKYSGTLHYLWLKKFDHSLALDRLLSKLPNLKYITIDGNVDAVDKYAMNTLRRFGVEYMKLNDFKQQQKAFAKNNDMMYLKLS